MQNKVDFGFGAMRLPVLNKMDATSFDYEKMEQLFDAFLEKGFTYFDTAYTYHRYEGEKAVKKALVERHPRKSFKLATKLPLRDFKDETDLETIFSEQLDNCGVSFFDAYLLHNMGYNVYEKCCRYDVFRFLERKKAEGKVLSTGMSFHDSPDLLDSILSKYGDCLDFVQLQVNYIDMDHPTIQSRKCLEIARKYGKPVTVMEPCKGGTLIKIPQEAESILKTYDPEASTASWAFRFAASQQGVSRVLSGMNSLEQVLDNCTVFQNFKPLNDKENALINEVIHVINQNTAIPCTACEYCTYHCPKKIAIPQYFVIYNSMKMMGAFSSQHAYYNNLVVAGHGRARDCIKCGLCEQACPQHLKIRQFLQNVSEKFDVGNTFPTRKTETVK